MFRLRSIDLVQFKNYPKGHFDFSKRVVGICGNNGVGKTNLLDAIYYLCFTKSYFARTDQPQILLDSDGFRLQGIFETDAGLSEVTCILKSGQKKEFFLDGVPYEKFSSHIGKFPSVMVCPDDVWLISGTGEVRRRFLDALCCQLDSQYLQSLMQYNRVLQQRNRLLKALGDRTMSDLSLLDVYDQQLEAPSEYVYRIRTEVFAGLLPLVYSHYLQIAGKQEPVEVNYRSQLQQATLAEWLQRQRPRDLGAQRSTAGIHRDDIEIFLQGQPFKEIASQGQRKSLLFAIKLAEFEMLKKGKGFAPLLLLDDAFEKLDAGRMRNLLHWICAENEGQIFITDTHSGRIASEIEFLGAGLQLVNL